MIKKKIQLFISFSSELKLIYNELKTVQKNKNCLNKLFFVNTHLILHQMVAMRQFWCALIGFPSKWGHKHIKIIVIGFWNTSSCKIFVIFFLFIVFVIVDRGFISSNSPFTLEVIKFSTEGKRWERHYHH